MNDKQRRVVLYRGLFALSPVLLVVGCIGQVSDPYYRGSARISFGILGAFGSLVAGLFVRAGRAPKLIESPQHKPAPKPGPHGEIWPQLESKPLRDVLAFIRQLPTTQMPVGHATALGRRLYEIALFDNHVPEEERRAAIDLYRTIQTSTEETLRDNPAALAAFKEANRHQEEAVYKFGVGSLAWLIKENRIPDGEVVAYLARPENKEGLEDFYAALGEPAASVVRAAVEKHVAETRAAKHST